MLHSARYNTPAQPSVSAHAFQKQVALFDSRYHEPARSTASSSLSQMQVALPGQRAVRSRVSEPQKKQTIQSDELKHYD
jgi:hypothetical protein